MSAPAPLMGPAGLQVARARHPAACGGRPDPSRLARRLWCQYVAAGYPEPEVAAAIAATRGTWGLDRLEFGRLLGLRTAELLAFEHGLVGLDDVPPRLLVADPFARVVAHLRATALSVHLDAAGSVSSPPPTTRRHG